MANPKARRMLKKLAEAGQKHDLHMQDRLQVAQQLLKVKELSHKPGAKKQLREELEVLEELMGRMVSLQGELLRKEDQQGQDIKQELQELKLKLKMMESGELAQKIQRIMFLIGELSARLDNYVEMKTNRDKRVEALEKKIQEQVSTNYKELQKLEKSIATLENRYEELRSSGAYSKEQLAKVQEKIEQLRQHLFKKRTEMITKKEEKLSVPPTQPAVPLLEKQERSSRVTDRGLSLSEPASRHKMMFPEPKEEPAREKPRHEINVPEWPQGENEKLIESMPPPIPSTSKHHSGILHFFKHMLGNEK